MNVINLLFADLKLGSHASAASLEGNPCLGNILVMTGQVTREQLGTALKRQETVGGRLGEILIAAGHTTLGEVARGLLLQQKLVAKELLAAMSVAAVLATAVPPAEAGQVSANLQVSATVVASTRMRTEYQATQLTITKDDIAQGHIDISAATRFSVFTNSRSGYLIEFYPVGDAFQAVQIKGLGHTAQLGADGGTVVQRGPVAPNMSHELSYRFTLMPGLQPGNYPWPLMLTVRPL
ncbi:MAG: hypothetical protein Q8K18_11205 [Burkholderiales bacterium]|nr:hypothetical protein [Burkholderiales bacterium]